MQNIKNIASMIFLIANIVIFTYFMRFKHNGCQCGNQLAIDTSVANMVESSESLKSEQVETKSKYDLSHLIQTTEYVAGPVQDDEAVLLYGLVKTLRPKTVVEFGFYKGDSSINFLKALDSDAKLYSFDVKNWNPNAESLNDSRFKLYLKSQTDFSSNDIDNRVIDLAYMDSSHTLDIEMPGFQKLIPHMAPTSVIVVHDTGLHISENKFRKKFFKCICDFDNLCGSAHAQGERLFINWIRANYPEWEIINLHSWTAYRHGLTILQRKYNFSTQAVDKSRCTYIQ